MTKTLRNIIISLCSVFAFLFAGFFFVGCGVDYSKIHITANRQSVNLEVGQTEDIIFTIEGYQDGFDHSNVNIEEDSNRDSSIFTYTKQQMDKTRIRVTVTATNGGEGTLTFSTFDGLKTCTVSIFVEQYAKSMKAKDDINYVSNDTMFQPTSALVDFDSNFVTYDKLNYYYFTPNADLDATFYLDSIDLESDKAIFKNGTGSIIDGSIVAFDKMKLVADEDTGENELFVSVNGSEFEEVDLVSKFSMLTVYERSVGNIAYEKIVYCLSDVYVLPSLKIDVTGGYVDTVTGDVDYQPLDGNTISIVPNNVNMTQFVLKIETNIKLEEESVITYKPLLENGFVNIEPLEVADEGEFETFYWLVSQNSQTQTTDYFEVEIYYNVAKGVQDDSVNALRRFRLDVKIAPIEVTVNGTSEPEPMVVYNSYKLDEYGWNELWVDVLSGLNSPANYDGIWFEFDETYLEIITSDRVNVANGNAKLYSDLNRPFFVRGVDKAPKTDKTTLVIHLVSDIIQDAEELTLAIDFSVVEGASYLNIAYAYTGDDNRYLKVDYDAEEVDFNQQLYAEHRFQGISYEHDGGEDVVEIIADNENPYVEGVDGYFLNMKVVPKKVGKGVYKIFLDNGLSRYVNFEVVKTLKAETTTFALASEGNESVSNYYYSRHEAEFDNVLNVEVLNPSTKDEITFNNYAFIKIAANLSGEGVKYIPGDVNIATVAKVNDLYRVATVKNGVTDITFTLIGNTVDDFKTVNAELTYYAKISSYSLVDEYYLKNGEDYALNNTVYYGSGVSTEDSSVKFDVVANNSKSTNFYKYEFDKKAVPNMYNSFDSELPDGSIAYNYTTVNTDYYSELIEEEYDQRFVYYYVQNSKGQPFDKTATLVEITKQWIQDGTTHEETRNVYVTFETGMMFYSEDFIYEERDEGGSLIALYTVIFSNIYYLGGSIGGFGYFDLDTLTYFATDMRSYSFVLSTNLRQRNSTKRYDAKIVSTPYKSIESISLSTAIDKLNFTNDKLSYTLGVYTYPTDATNKRLRVDFELTNGNPYTDMVEIVVDYSEQSKGTYTISVSCENFYRNNIANIVNIEESLTGRIYVYPAEWGSNYTSLTKKPLCIDVHYRNGSRNNPYLLEKPEDILAINANETTLQSHYELNTVIDMSAISGATPIGIIERSGNKVLVGFSGSLTGTTAQASITNLFVNNSNFVETVDGIQYAGLFAQLNEIVYDEVTGNIIEIETPMIENVSITGKVDLDLQRSAYVGLAVAINKGIVRNLGTRIVASSSIETVASTNVYYGSVAAVNYGQILQDFTLYESGAKFAGQNARNLAYFNDYLTIDADSTNLFAGGVVGATAGLVERTTSTELKLYGYSAYSAYTLIKVTGKTVQNDYSNIYLGGVAGAVAYNNYSRRTHQKSMVAYIYNQDLAETTMPIMAEETVESGIAIKSMLVGGEISTQDIVSKTATEKGYTDYVGGVVGYAHTANVDRIDIWTNNSRIFVRGYDYVGTICGYDFVDASVDDRYRVNFGSGNYIEAVDDGRNTLYSAMLIKFKQVAFDAAGVYGMVGNASETRRNYGSAFRAVSYLKRIVNPSTALGSTTDTSTTHYYGDLVSLKKVGNVYEIFKTVCFETKEVGLGEDADNPYLMTNDAVEGVSVYFMYYFGVDNRVSGSTTGVVQDEVVALNTISPNSDFYPIKITSQDVNISTAEKAGLLSVDIHGNITAHGVGLATLTLTSILNRVESKTVYIYITNYFDKDVAGSVFYTSRNASGMNVVNGSQVAVYGNSNTNIYLVPTYTLDDTATYLGENDKYSITKEGVLSYKNVAYNLTRNSQLFADCDENVKTFSSVQVNKQTIIFYKSAEAIEGAVDSYTLVPMLQVSVTIGEQAYLFVYELSASEIDLSVVYKDTASAIRPDSVEISIKTNEPYTDTVTVDSTNDEEYLFYEIFYREGDEDRLVQSRMPENINDCDSEAEWRTFVNTLSLTDDLFNVTLARKAGKINVFDYSLRVNSASDAFVNRFETGIFGKYVIFFYATELYDGVFATVELNLDEAGVNYIAADNYSNINDVSVVDDILVPGQNGLIEVFVDPVEAVFNTFTIENMAQNSNKEAANALFTFVYEKQEAGSELEFVRVDTFGSQKDGKFSFTYDEMISFLNTVSVSYVGKVYIMYNMPSKNVSDSVAVGFNVSVTYGNRGEFVETYPVYLTTKLGSYAELVFDNKQDAGGYYYVARGLSYDLTLNYYGYTADQIEIQILDANGQPSDASQIVSINKVGSKHVLTVTSENIVYDGGIGKEIMIKTIGEKIVNGEAVRSEDSIRLYVMEYVFNYVYEEGVYHDLVRGMVDGVISTAIGNPYELQLSIRSFLEYDKSNPIVSNEVDTFVGEMSSNVTWTVYMNGEDTVLSSDSQIRTDYYQIAGYTVTPLRVYNSKTSDVYSFSMDSYYTMRNGVYTYSATKDGAERVYTVFEFDVHDQSTQDSPIPIEDYNDLIDKMADGEWYILLNDIVLPSMEYAAIHDVEQFAPLTARIAGLDGNGYSLQFAGTYDFGAATQIGVFATNESGAILQNVTVRMTSDTIFKTSAGSFDVGLLTASNEGIITNCAVEASNNSTLSVVCSEKASSAYVAGLVGKNNGYITNSRSKVSIFSNVNLAGFVGENSGTIASSYYMGASLRNETTTTAEYTAGFVVTNTNSGRIFTSYVSGTPEAGIQYYNKRSENEIRSSNSLAGFIYSNEGTVADCYSNIQLKQSGTYASGFVFENGGTVARCFSTSIMENDQTSNYGFARTNFKGSIQGKLEDCYYLQENGINENIGEIALEDSEGLKPLSSTQFGNMENFKNYVYVEGRDINSVWFFNDKTTDYSNFNSATFNTGRLELVSANIIAYSRRQLDRIETIVDDKGATSARYVYIYALSSQPLGSVYNPILINDYKTMETYISRENTSAGFNYSYYRLISDVTYEGYTENSQLFKTKFVGYLEGNFMKISGVTLVDSESVNYAGLFAEVGRSSLADSVGTLMNFTYEPLGVSFANANAVGALTGRLDGGTIVNVDIVRDGTDAVYVEGNNIVGGAIGVAVGNYKIQNLYSQVGAIVRNWNIGGSAFVDGEDMSRYSYAGSLVGVLSGRGYIYNIKVDKVVSVYADTAGLVFGYIDSGATAEKIDVLVDDSMIISAYGYGGFVTGESRGTVKNVNVHGSDQAFTNIKQVFTAEGIGGFAGLISGGSVSDVTISKSISVSTQSTQNGIQNLGGFAGVINEVAEISNIKVSGEFTGFQYVGGIVGTINNKAGRVVFKDIVLEMGKLNLYGHRMDETGIGGLVGCIVDNGSFELSATGTNRNYFNVVANQSVYVYASDIDAGVGAVVGLNVGVMEQSVESTDSTITATVHVYDLVSNEGKQESTSTLKVSSTGNLTGGEVELEGGEIKTIITRRVTRATDSYYYCNIVYIRPNADEASNSYNLYASMYGLAKVFEAD